MTAVRNQNGFTLAELLIAITIFAVGLLAIAGMQITAIQTNSSASEITARVALAEGIMEEILSLAGTNPIFLSSTDDEEGLPSWGDGDVEIAGAGIFRNTYRITVDDPVPRVSRVEVTVRNTVGRNFDRPVTITALKRR